MRLEKFLKDNAQAVLDTKIQCLEWFVDDDISQLYTMIEENMGIDEWFDEMSHRIYEYQEKFYIFEEEDFLKIQEMESN